MIVIQMGKWTGVAQSLGYGLDGRGLVPGWGSDGYFFLFPTVFRLALGPTQPSTQWAPGALTPEEKCPGREADRSLPSSTEITNAWSCTSIPQYVFMAWYLVKYRDNFTLLTCV